MVDDYDALLSDAERALDEVDQALERLDQGTYGTCETCGEPIDDRRLADLPAARSCADHPRLPDPIVDASLPGPEPNLGMVRRAPVGLDPSADPVSDRPQ